MNDLLKFSEMNEVVIKHCQCCGYTKRMQYRYNTCPECNLTSMVFFRNTSHLISFINIYGLGNIDIKNDDLRESVINAFS